MAAKRIRESRSYTPQNEIMRLQWKEPLKRWCVHCFDIFCTHTQKKNHFSQVYRWKWHFQCSLFCPFSASDCWWLLKPEQTIPIHKQKTPVRQLKCSLFIPIEKYTAHIAHLNVNLSFILLVFSRDVHLFHNSYFFISF